MCQRHEIASATRWIHPTPGPLALSFHQWDDNARPALSADPLPSSMGADRGDVSEEAGQGPLCLIRVQSINEGALQ
jgi:hypothetical protein